MKLTDIARPGLMLLGAAGLTAAAVLGFTAGVIAGRDPEALRRTAQRVAREAARGFERAALFAAQAREHVGDLWAEAREEALAEVDAADFAKAAARGRKAPAGAAASARPARKRASAKRAAPARKRRSAAQSGAQAADTKATSGPT
ncbi:MAG: hypothetical protein E6H65_02175 [Betaproteobacteria bacterium]|nr:MAG: hypothetical protein E6H65_02175 [Betaproteobacteria bacterium]